MFVVKMTNWAGAEMCLESFETIEGARAYIRAEVVPTLEPGDGVMVIETESEDDPEEFDGFNSDAEADADVLRNAGMGTDEDYGYYGGDEYY